MIKNQYLEMFDPELATKLMLQGKNQEQIGKILGGIPKQRVSELFKQFGIKYIRRTMPINDTYFDEIDSEDKAYLLGFLIADGCIRAEKRKNGNISYRICFSNSIEDKEATIMEEGSTPNPDPEVSVDDTSNPEIGITNELVNNQPEIPVLPDTIVATSEDSVILTPKDYQSMTREECINEFNKNSGIMPNITTTTESK